MRLKAHAEDANAWLRACIAYVISFIIRSKMHEVNNPKYSLKSSVKMRKQQQYSCNFFITQFSQINHLETT